MAELRYNPLLRDWTMVASNRQTRPDMPKTDCPFCPGSGRVPDSYEVYQYDNDFPALSPNPPTPDDAATGIYQTAEAYGKCEVILYSSNHNTTLPQLSLNHIRKLVDLWSERYAVLSTDKRHKYVLIFENRGPEVGVTMPHPHGQIYAYPYVPQKVRVELESSSNHFQQTGHCLLCDINSEEQSFKTRMLIETEHFVSYIPFFTDFPYGAFISIKTHKSNMLQLTDEEKTDLARILKRVTSGMDALFDREFPYMMVVHQSPVNQEHTRDDIENGDGAELGENAENTQVDEYYHFHIEFYPPLRDKDKVKYMASSETGAWAPCNTMAVEDAAGFLRAAILAQGADADDD